MSLFLAFLGNAIESLQNRMYVQLRKMNITPLAILGVKWPFSKGRDR